MARADLKALTDNALRAVFAVLRDSRNSLVEQVTRGLTVDTAGDTSDFNVFAAQARAAAVERELDAVAEEMVRRASSEIQAAAEDAVEDLLGDVSKTGLRVPFVGTDANTIALARSMAADQIRRVVGTMKAQARIHLQRALAGGLTLPQLTAELRGVFGSAKTLSEVDRIVRTELARVYNQAQAVATKTMAKTDIANDVIKVWRTAGDGPAPAGRVRAEHHAIDGQERELWQPFNMGDHERGLVVTAADGPSNKGYRITAPLDPVLPAHLAINCRCFVVIRPRSARVMPYTAKTAAQAAAKRKRQTAALVA